MDGKHSWPGRPTQAERINSWLAHGVTLRPWDPDPSGGSHGGPETYCSSPGRQVRTRLWAPSQVKCVSRIVRTWSEGNAFAGDGGAGSPG